jgi:hypothetical protein
MLAKLIANGYSMGLKPMVIEPCAYYPEFKIDIIFE